LENALITTEGRWDLKRGKWRQATAALPITKVLSNFASNAPKLQLQLQRSGPSKK